MNLPCRMSVEAKQKAMFLRSLMHILNARGFCMQQLGLIITKAFAMHIRNAEHEFGLRSNKLPDPDDTTSRSS